jgi:hypothetical protein
VTENSVPKVGDWKFQIQIPTFGWSPKKMESEEIFAKILRFQLLNGTNFSG